MDTPWRELIGSFFGLKPPPAPAAPPERRREVRVAATLQVTLRWLDGDDQDQVAKGVLENISPNGFGIRTTAKLEEGMTVWITRPDSPALKSVVRHVQTSDEFYVLGCARIQSERRREDRVPAEGSALLRWTGAQGQTKTTEVLIRNVSTEGVQVESSETVLSNQIARLIGAAVECTGAVRYCVPRNQTFLVGLFLIGKAQRKESLEREFID